MAVNVEGSKGNYAHAGNLKSRVSLYDYREPQFDPVDVAADLMPADPRLVLDVGCGHGRYLKRLRADHPAAAVVGIDAAPGMLSEVEPPIMVADARAIPYPDGSVDAVLAMHMLYHVPDIAKAVGEFRRVLKPGGTLLVSTNTHDDMAEPYAHWARAIRAVLGPDTYIPSAEVANFDSANAPDYLEAAFGSVERFEKRGLVSVPEPRPLMDYLVSIRSYVDCDDAAFDRILAVAAAELESHFAAHDVFEFEKAIVFYRCR
ncbi:methyltransferase domain-containing protein [Glycomyces luteolus]|uniref:Methyltransferase domain-containing protein n=1 Tax=Glycomyces luteolus TaxID=2670330 RepID=A0A9X3PAG6_9ACTN|nr:class I SAM-dependent methyltransferase [Glycomyces luteolus]MDA1360032.1 methyltransferase domain-containing protein [Glycomyces luteolus]